MDVLDDVLALARVRAALLATFDARAPWGIDLPARAGASFHAVLSGVCWLQLDGGPAQQLTAGDLILLPGGARHALSTEIGLPLRPFDEQLKRELITEDGELVLEGPGARTRILCAGYDYDAEVAHPLLALLPPIVQIATLSSQAAPNLPSLLSLLAAETRGGTGAGTAAVRLLDVLLVHVMRIWASTDDGASGVSWLTGLRDPMSAQVLSLLHARPAEAWTLDSLAAEVHVSRATLARRFHQAVGEPPLAYLTRWRMDLAARRLRESTAPVALIARDVGYTSEYAFNRAFARHRGLPPGRYRRA
jgi:AraC-like DNA-binding protein